jgi:hypothetical protein
MGVVVEEVQTVDVMASNSDEIKQGTINYYKKAIVDKEVDSSNGDAKGNFDCYNDNTKEAQESSLILYGVNNPIRDIDCLLVTKYEDETIPDQKPSSTKSCFANEFLGWEFYTKTNTKDKTNPDTLDPSLFISPVSFPSFITYNFENGYNVDVELGLIIDTDPSFQKLFGLDGKAQVVKVDTKGSREIIFMEFIEQKIVGKFDLSKAFDTISDSGRFSMTNLNGNVSDIIMPTGLCNSVTIELEDVQVKTFKPTRNQTSLDLKITNCPNLFELIDPYGNLGLPSYENVEIENCPSLVFVYNWIPGEIFIVKDCPKLDAVSLSDVGNPGVNTNIVILENLPVITFFNDSGTGIRGGSFTNDPTFGVFINNCESLTNISYRTDPVANCYIPTIQITNTSWNYQAPFVSPLFNSIGDLTIATQTIDIKNNNFSESDVDLILQHIDGAPWSTASIGGNTIDISGNNAAPSATGAGHVASLQAKGWTVTTS